MPASIKGWVGEKPSGKKPGNDPFDVQTVQKLLQGAASKLKLTALDPKSSDGRMTTDTITAITAFQRDVMKSTKPDGRVDVQGRTWKSLVKAAGEVDTNPDGFPPRPSFNALNATQRATMFGTFEYELDDKAADPDAIRIKGDWMPKNITTATIPQLANIGQPRNTQQSFHTLAAKQFVNLWKAWEDEGVLNRVLTYHGSFVPRFQRGTSRTVNVSSLSNHSWGTAFDINAPQNGLNQTPAIIWEDGCVFELVEIANDHGFFWGGHFSTRYDGMHFEIAKLL